MSWVGSRNSSTIFRAWNVSGPPALDGNPANICDITCASCCSLLQQSCQYCINSLWLLTTAPNPRLFTDHTCNKAWVISLTWTRTAQCKEQWSLARQYLRMCGLSFCSSCRCSFSHHSLCSRLRLCFACRANSGGHGIMAFWKVITEITGPSLGLLSLLQQLWVYCYQKYIALVWNISAAINACRVSHLLSAGRILVHWELLGGWGRSRREKSDHPEMVSTVSWWTTPTQTLTVALTGSTRPVTQAMQWWPQLQLGSPLWVHVHYVQWVYNPLSALTACRLLQANGSRATWMNRQHMSLSWDVTYDDKASLWQSIVVLLSDSGLTYLTLPSSSQIPCSVSTFVISPWTFKLRKCCAILSSVLNWDGAIHTPSSFASHPPTPSRVQSRIQNTWYDISLRSSVPKPGTSACISASMFMLQPHFSTSQYCQKKEVLSWHTANMTLLQLGLYLDKHRQSAD